MREAPHKINGKRISHTNRRKEFKMKKNANYEINFATNTITVTKKFREAASIIGTPEFNVMKELRALNMTITERIINRTCREDRWNYKRMAAYIRNVDDADRYMADFDALRDAVSYMKVWAWFKVTFPNYAKTPEMDDNHRIVVTHLDCDKETALQAIA